MSKEANWIFDEVEKHSKKKKLPNVGLEVVTKIGNKLLDKNKKLAKKEEELKALKAEIREIQEKELPDAMQACNGLTRFDLKDGSSIVCKDEIFCSFKADKKPEALKWIEKEETSLFLEGQSLKKTEVKLTRN